MRNISADTLGGTLGIFHMRGHIELHIKSSVLFQIQKKKIHVGTKIEKKGTVLVTLRTHSIQLGTGKVHLKTT